MLSPYKNQDKDIYIIESDDAFSSDNDNKNHSHSPSHKNKHKPAKTLNLSAKHLTTIPDTIVRKNVFNNINTLILSKNRIHSFKNLKYFYTLQILQLDRNEITDECFLLSKPEIDKKLLMHKRKQGKKKRPRHKKRNSQLELEFEMMVAAPAFFLPKVDDKKESDQAIQQTGPHAEKDFYFSFPKLPYLHTLWLNNNKLENLTQLLTILSLQCRSLKYLSLLCNPLCPLLQAHFSPQHSAESNTSGGATSAMFTISSSSEFEQDKEVQLSREQRAVNDYHRTVAKYLPTLRYLDILKLGDCFTHSRLCLSHEQMHKELIWNQLEVQTDAEVDMLTESQMKQIIYCCPSMSHYCSWKSVYNMFRDGASFNTFSDSLVRCSDPEMCDSSMVVVLIRDMNTRVFGAFLSGVDFTNFIFKSSLNSSQGNIDSFVFHFAGVCDSQNDNLYVHRATGSHPYYVCINDYRVNIGTAANPAIYFDIKNLKIGATQECATFNNPPLTRATNHYFQMQSIEVWCPEQ